MEQYEKINCFVRYEASKVVCVCKVSKKHSECAKAFGCEREPLLRDKYFGWKEAFRNQEGSKS